MKIPKDVSLSSFIRDLIRTNKVEKFYKTDEWIWLRRLVLEFFHYECQECLKKGTYTRADCVHHVNEVRQRPDLALSRYYIDENGEQQYNLIPLCNTCHNVVHEKLIKWQQKDKFKNEERW